jgi:crotonobetainyl-CoA:carnitine CoA-transferase CaiB-like acyl-CoA transferase
MLSCHHQATICLSVRKERDSMHPVVTSQLSETLSGVTVLDLSRNLAGPYCTMLLADLGADVIKVESPGSGDDTRNWRPPEWNGESAAFLACNRNKRSITIDLDVDAGQQLIRQLAAHADVVVSSFRPGSLAKRGLDFESLGAFNEGLVYCSITAYGPKGPKKDAPGYDPILQAETGLMSMTGHPDGPPARIGVGAFDLGTGMWAAVGIQAALQNRSKSGIGALVEVSLYETAAWLLSYHLEGYLATGESPQRQGNGAPFVAPYETFATADGDLMVTAGNDRLFVSLCQVLGVPDLALNPDYVRNADRVANRIVLHQLLEHRFKERTAVEWEVLLSAENFPCSRVRSVGDLAGDVQLDALGMLVDIPHPDIPDLRVVDIPLTLNGERATHRFPPPRLGEQTTSILEELGIPPEEIETLLQEGVVTCEAQNPRRD